MRSQSTRRDFLRQGTVLVASGLAVSQTMSSDVPASKQPEEGAGPHKHQLMSKPGSSLGSDVVASAEKLKGFAEDPTKHLSKNFSWYAETFLRAHFDVGVTDACSEAFSKLDIDDIVATLSDSGVELPSFYVQDPSGWLYYPSKVGQQHPNLKGRDVIAECATACHKHGLKFLGYFVPFENGIEVTGHPEWRVELGGSTVPSSPRLWGNLCFNRPGRRDYYLRIVREAVSQYEIDLVWFDGVWRRHCGCAYSQKRYKEETGRELPSYYSWPNMTLPYNPNRAEYGDYFHHMRKWVEQWGMDLLRTVKEVRPDCVVEFQYIGYKWGGDTGFTVGMTNVADFITTDSGGLKYQYQHSLAFKCLRGFSRNLPIESETPIAEHHGNELSPKQVGLLKQQFAYILVHGGVVIYIDDIDWQGRISKRKYARLKRVSAWARERFLYLGGVMVADVGLYFSHESTVYRPMWHDRVWDDTRGTSEHGGENWDFSRTSIHSGGNVAFVEAMIRENIPFDVLHRNHLEDLGRHKVIVLNNVELLSNKETTALCDYVRFGGGLFVTHRTGLRDERFQKRENFSLADLVGADYLETPDLATSFIVVGENDRKEGFFTKVHLETPYFEVHGPPCYVKPREGTRFIAKIGQPRRPYNEDGQLSIGLPPVMQLIDPKEIRQFNVGFLYSPEIVTDLPVIVLHEYGRGRVAYCAAVPFYDTVEDLHDLIVALVNWAAGGKLDNTVASNAPGPVEIITMEQSAWNRSVVHVLSWQNVWPAALVRDVEVALKTFGRTPKRAWALEAKREVPTAAGGGRVSVKLPPVEAWESVVIDWA
jgi:Hypothetical glycosyl hydrolase 6/Beta-galactosidase trimerisation domain